MESPGGQTLFVVTGPYGLVGRRFMEAVPDLVPLDVAPPPPDIAPWFRPAVSLPPVDITDEAGVAGALERVAAAAAGRPVTVVHFAALTDTKGGDAALFERVNVHGTENVLRSALAVGARFIHVSTDYVFAGESKRGEAYDEGERPYAVPPGIYATSKFRAENIVLNTASPQAVVARIAFPYGGRGNRPGLAEKLIQRLEDARRKKEAVALFNDQSICPSYIPDIARGLIALSRRLASGGQGRMRTFHLVGDPTTPHDFGLAVRRAFGFEDVAVSASSVKGTPYAENLHLSSDLTRKALDWRPTPHEQALREFHRRG